MRRQKGIRGQCSNDERGVQQLRNTSLTPPPLPHSIKRRDAILSHHLEGELVHEVDLVRVGDVSVLEILHRHRERGAEEADLPLPSAVVHQLFQHRLKLG